MRFGVYFLAAGVDFAAKKVSATTSFVQLNKLHMDDVDEPPDPQKFELNLGDDYIPEPKKCAPGHCQFGHFGSNAAGKGIWRLIPPQPGYEKRLMDDALKCNGCNTVFKSFMGKSLGTRHHCRACGNAFCGNCCHKRRDIALPFGKDGKQRPGGFFKNVVGPKIGSYICDDCALRILTPANTHFDRWYQIYHKLSEDTEHGQRWLTTGRDATRPKFSTKCQFCEEDFNKQLSELETHMASLRVSIGTRVQKGAEGTKDIFAKRLDGVQKGAESTEDYFVISDVKKKIAEINPQDFESLEKIERDILAALEKSHVELSENSVAFRNFCGHWVCQECVPNLMENIYEEMGERKKKNIDKELLTKRNSQLKLGDKILETKFDDVKQLRDELEHEGFEMPQDLETVDAVKAKLLEQMAAWRKEISSTKMDRCATCGKGFMWLTKQKYFRDYLLDLQPELSELSVPDFFHHFDRRVALSKPDALKCPHCGRIAEYPADATDGNNVKCKFASCAKHFCSLCGMKLESGQQCQKCQEHPIYQVLNAYKTQYCPNPKCGKVVQKTEDCNRMRCVCGTIFCIDCGKNLSREDYDHWSDSYKSCGYVPPGGVCRSPKPGCPRQNNPHSNCLYCRRGVRGVQRSETFFAGPDHRTMEFNDVDQRAIKFVAKFTNEKIDLKANKALLHVDSQPPVEFEFHTVIANDPGKNGAVTFEFFGSADHAMKFAFDVDKVAKLKTWLRSWLNGKSPTYDREWNLARS